MAELFSKYSCTYCQEDIVGIRIHCADCEEFELCLQCFAAGAEIGPHRSDHRYQLMDTGALSLTRAKNSWAAREEVHLLDAVEQFGFGSWEDISKHIETRSPEEAKEEYINKYLVGIIGRHTWEPAAELRPQLIDHTVPEEGSLSPESSHNLPPIDVTPEEAKQLGYMPNRNVFEREYDPTAEQLVSNLSLNGDDTDSDIVIKLAQVDMYTRRLRERTRRKRIVRDFQLIANFFRKNQLPNVRSRHSKEQREFRDRFRVFGQFFTAHEFERRLNSLEREKALRVRLSELCRYRWNGLTRIDESIHFEQHAAAASARNTGPYGQEGRTEPKFIGEQHPCSMHSVKIEESSENEEIENSNSIGPKSMPLTDDLDYSGGSSPPRNSLDNYRPLGQLPMDPVNQFGGNLLTPKEADLCSKMNLQPTNYLTMKTIFLSGLVSPEDPVTPTENTIKDYLIKSGWLNPLLTT